MITILSDDKTCELGQAIFDRVRKNNNNTHFFDLHDINIKPCYACRGCEEKTYQRCIVRDDADLLLPYIAQSSILIAVMKIAYGSYSFQIKRVMDKFILITDKHYRLKNGELVKGLKPPGVRFYAVGVHDSADKAEIQAFEQLVSETLNIVSWDGKSIVTSFSSYNLNEIYEEIMT